MASIYDTVPSWSSLATYSKYDIVKGSNNYFYYSLIDNNNNNNPTIDSNLQSKWDGYILLNSVLYPHFFWQASYNSSVKNEPRVKRLRFGNGYEQRISDSINFNLVNIELQFNLRTEKEILSALHFLDQRAGKQAFIYNPPTLLNKSALSTKFICPQWDFTYVSYNNYSLRCTLEEVSA